jgi:hypothetical protein
MIRQLLNPSTRPQVQDAASLDLVRCPCREAGCQMVLIRFFNAAGHVYARAPMQAADLGAWAVRALDVALTAAPVAGRA